VITYSASPAARNSTTSGPTPGAWGGAMPFNVLEQAMSIEPVIHTSC
jgi:hypothetical protein